MKSAPALTVALAGNPNCGKTTVFNNLTGSNQHVGNYPGVTVEKREGTVRSNNTTVRIVDLPGTYSLTAYSEDELVARNFIIQENPDVVANVLDASNLERNLYLTVQLLELGKPMVFILNMVDIAHNRGYVIDDQAFTTLFKTPVIRTVGNRNHGTAELLSACITANKQHISGWQIDYGSLEPAISQLCEQLTTTNLKQQFPVRWIAIKLLENDAEIIKLVQTTASTDILLLANSLRVDCQLTTGQDPELVIAERRYQSIAQLLEQVVIKNVETEVTSSDKIDRLLTHRLLGLPIFLALMWLLFNLVFTLAEAPQTWLESGFSLLSDWAGMILPAGNLHSLIVDGIIGGVGGVMSFLPQILLLFLGIALLEGTGYMARAAFLMDRVLRSVGLHGKSFIPMLIGFGCSVPAIMATRTLENSRDRLVTILVTPFMSCSARLPVYTVLISAFFSRETAGTVLFSIYLFGIIVAVIMARLFRSIYFKGSVEPFVMELPPYHLPTLNSIFIQMWERGVLYLKKAGTIILTASIAIWFLTNYPTDVNYTKNYDALILETQSQFETQIQTEIISVLTTKQLGTQHDFNSLLNAVTVINQNFADQIVDLAAGSVELAAAEKKYHDQLSQIKLAKPHLFSLVEHYNSLQAANVEQLSMLTNEQTAEKMVASYAGRIGKTLEPLIQPLGFDWKIGIGLFAGFAAKEVLVSTLATIYSMGTADEGSIELQQALVADPIFNPLVAYTLMIFVLLYTPCLAVIAVIRRETNSWRWPIFSIFYTLIVAWSFSFLVRFIGTLLGF